MSQKFQAAVQHRGDVSFVKLGGVIDEDNELGELVDKIPNGTAVIDLGEVERINSCGVRDWVNWLGKIEKNGSRAVLVECSPAIVAQINLVNNFTGNGVVKSFYVPYFCPECDEEKVLLVDAADMGPPPHEPPTCRCDECDLVMDFDDMPDSYFAFLSNQRKLSEADLGFGGFASGTGGGPGVGTGAGSPGVMGAAGATGGGNVGSGKIKTRASQPGLGVPRQSVPSLPSIQQRSSAQATGPQMIPAGTPSGRQLAPQLRPPSKPPSKPMFSNGVPGMQNNLSSSGMRAPQTSPFQMPQSQATGPVSTLAAPPKGNALVFVLVAILLVAIGVLAYLVLTK